MSGNETEVMSVEMKGRKARFASSLLLLLASAGALAESHVLITGEWPPYTGVREPQGGSITAIVRQAFAAQNDEIRVGFFPWSRVQRMVRLNRAYTGKFPDYYSAERARECHFSQPVGESPLGLAEVRGRAVNWRSMDDLLRYRVGVVGTYVNTPEFDELVLQGKMQVVTATDDEENLRNLLQGKAEVAIIDRNVYAYILQKESVQGAAQQLQLNPAVLIVHKLYVCFQKNDQGKAIRDRFDQGLRSLQAPVPEL